MADQNREYQERAKALIRAEFKKGNKRVLLWCPTGGGKTKIFCDMIKAVAERERKAAVIVRGRKLVDQASKRLARENVNHGVLMANHYKYRPTLPIQACSIDTLRARNIDLDVDLLVVDEGHLFTSNGDVEFLNKMTLKPRTFTVTVTATPYCPKGLRHLADAMVKPISMIELIEMGYLVPFRYFAPQRPELGNVQVVTNADGGKDYNQAQLEKTMIEGQLTGKIIEHWKEIADGIPTLGFAVSIPHSKMMARRFCEAGIPAEHCDADTPEEEREAILERLNNGTTLVVWNVGIFVTGVDVPKLGALIDAAPTMSYNKYVQKYGRLTRCDYAPGFDLETQEGRLASIAASKKTHGIVLDHAGNIQKHQFPTDEPDVDLDGNVRRSHDKQTKQCKLCFMMFRGPFCPDCGPQEKEGTFVILEESEGKLAEIKDIELDPVKRAHKELLRRAKVEKRKPTWASYKLIDRFGLEKAKPYLTEAFVKRYENKQSNLFGTSMFKSAWGSDEIPEEE